MRRKKKQRAGGTRQKVELRQRLRQRLQTRGAATAGVSSDGSRTQIRLRGCVSQEQRKQTAHQLPREKNRHRRQPTMTATDDSQH